MPARQFPGLGLTGGRTEGENGWADEMNTNLQLLSAAVQIVVDSTEATEPGSPTDGDIHIDTGPWGGGTAGDIVIRDNGAWVSITPKAGWICYEATVGEHQIFNGTTWEQFQTPGLFLGTFVDLAALQVAHPTASEGNYAHVDAGNGTDVTLYVWDNDDSAYIEIGTTGSMTGAQIAAALDAELGANWRMGTGAEIVTAINNELGNTDWQTGGGGGGSEAASVFAHVGYDATDSYSTTVYSTVNFVDNIADIVGMSYAAGEFTMTVAATVMLGASVSRAGGVDQAVVLEVDYGGIGTWVELAESGETGENALVTQGTTVVAAADLAIGDKIRVRYAGGNSPRSFTFSVVSSGGGSGGTMTGAEIVSAIDAELGSSDWQSGGGGGGEEVTENLTIVNPGFETGDLTGWTAAATAAWVESRTSGTVNWSGSFDATFGDYILTGGIESSSGASQDIDVSGYSENSGAVYTISSKIVADDGGTADSVTCLVELLDSGDSVVASASKTETTTGTNTDDLVVTGDGTEVTLRITVSFVKGAAGGYINAAADGFSGSVVYTTSGGTMTGAEIVSAIDAELGSSDWQSGGGGGSMESLSDTDIDVSALTSQHSGQPVTFDHATGKFVVAPPGFDAMKLGGGAEVIFQSLDVATDAFTSIVLDEGTYGIDNYDEILVVYTDLNVRLTVETSSDGGVSAENVRKVSRWDSSSEEHTLHTQFYFGPASDAVTGCWGVGKIMHHSDPLIPTMLESFGGGSSNTNSHMNSVGIIDTPGRNNAITISMANDTVATSNGSLTIIGIKKSRQPLEWLGTLAAAASLNQIDTIAHTMGAKFRAGDTVGKVFLSQAAAGDLSWNIEDDSATVIASLTITAGNTEGDFVAVSTATLTGAINIKSTTAGEASVVPTIVVRGELA